MSAAQEKACLSSLFMIDPICLGVEQKKSQDTFGYQGTDATSFKLALSEQMIETAEINGTCWIYDVGVELF